MNRLTWKCAGGLFPFLLVLILLDLKHPYRTTAVIGLAIIWSNAVGYIEAALNFDRGGKS